jgi:hypothetical protein
MWGKLRLRPAAACVFVWIAFISGAQAWAHEDKPLEVAASGIVVIKRGTTGPVKDERAQRG